jgi:hypothetical protein
MDNMVNTALKQSAEKKSSLVDNEVDNEMYTPEFHGLPHQLWLITGYEYYPENYPAFPMLYVWKYWNSVPREIPST